MSVDEIDKIRNTKVLSDEKFCDDLPNFASKVETKNGTIFRLKDNSDWHPLLPFLKVSSIIPLVQKFIDEKPDSLINFPSIPHDSIHLLFSPTLWALHYYILSHKCCKDYQVIQQFVFNTLIITSQNSDQFYKGKNSQESNKNSILKVKDFCDFAFQLKTFTFNDFLTVKVVFSKSENEPKSMVDLISVFGNVGITVLTRLNMSNVGENSIEESRQKKEEIMKKKHERAKQLKMQIMSNFIKKQKTFQASSSLQENENEEREKNEVEKSSKIVCSICQIENEDDCFVYPALIYKNSLQSYIKWRFRKAQIGSEFSNDFSEIPKSFDSFNCVRICLHQIHSKCIHGEKFTCPYDRCHRNASIPIIAGIFDEKTELDKKVFLQAQNFLKKAYYNDPKFALFSLASQIEILEMRHRSNPGCLDDYLNHATLRNIYLCIWHVMRKEVSKIIDFESTRNSKKMEVNLCVEHHENHNNHEHHYHAHHNHELDIVSLILSLINEERNHGNTINDMAYLYNGKKIITIQFTPLMFYITSFLIEKNVELDAFASDDFIFDFKDDLDSDYKWIQFLRCAAIFDHFARGIKITQSENEKTTLNNEFIDWDAILNPSNLCKHYNVHRAFNTINNNNDDEMTLPMFSLINLPKFYLDFIHPPFSAPILVSNDLEVLLCLLTGKTILRKSSSSPGNHVNYAEVSRFLNNDFNGSFSVFLVLNGSNASQVIIGDTEFNKFYTLRPFYTDKVGDKDVGMKRGSLLYLNEPIIEEIIDEILSGSWTNSF